MSRYSLLPFDLSGFSTRPLSEREHKVEAGSVATPFPVDGSLSQFLESIPRTLAGEELRELAECIRLARASSSGVGRPFPSPCHRG